MKEYTEKDPKRIEDFLAVLIGAELVKANELKQYKENGLRVVAYELEDIPRLINSELTLIIGLIRTDAEGGKTWYCFTPEAQEIWDNDRKAQEFRYWETINRKMDASKHYFLNALRKSPNPAETIADRIRQAKWKLNPDSDPNAPKELCFNPSSHLKVPWTRLKRGLREYKTGVFHYYQVLADTENEFLKWLIDYQKEHAKYTSAAPQESKGSTEVKNEPKIGLTYKLKDAERKELVAELARYVNDSTSLTELLKGNPDSNRVKVTCKQNEFAEVFKRLQYNGKIVQPIKDIVQWVSENFEQSDGRAFSSRTIEDLFKPSGKPPKERICDFEWLTFKDASTLAKEANDAKMNNY